MERFAACARIYAAEPARYFYPDQYGNHANWRAHYEATAPEIWEQTRGRVTHFVAGLGTSGTFVGTHAAAEGVESARSGASACSRTPGFMGSKVGSTWPQRSCRDLRSALADENLAVSTEDAYRMVKRLAREEGLLVVRVPRRRCWRCLQVAGTFATASERSDRHDLSGFGRKIFERAVLERIVSASAISDSEDCTKA